MTLRALALGLGIAALVHAVLYRRTLARARAAEAARLPTGPDGIVPGAEPIALDGSHTHAALLIHGFGDTPQSVAGLAAYLHTGHGWTVRAPLLPGHGRGLADFDQHGFDAWREAVHREYTALEARHDVVVLVGQSMGGALATLEAARDPSLPALVLLAPYLTAPANAERLAPLAGIINLLMPYLKGGNKVASIFDPEARAKVLGAGAVPPRRIRDLVAVAHDARFAAADVRAPTLLIHSRTDYRIPLLLAQRHQGLFSRAAICEQVWLDGCGHVITVDYRREQVWAATADWLQRYAGSPAALPRRVS